MDKCCALGSAEKGPATDAVEVPESIDKSPAVRPNVPTGAGASSVLGEVKLRGCMVKLHNRGIFLTDQMPVHISSHSSGLV